ncbi:hypothetical protein HOLleu_19589 [Holothuria leucospilota]|uniref:Uncharacterized protein n=1 Tax=Holothuria leucospilota TaxID=206669 RepID=A0A9Q1H7B3_HOLLE|nr:hypothetical protein HOLleu_19589 [Holothuria leucospilota]
MRCLIGTPEDVGMRNPHQRCEKTDGGSERSLLGSRPLVSAPSCIAVQSPLFRTPTQVLGTNGSIRTCEDRDLEEINHHEEPSRKRAKMSVGSVDTNGTSPGEEEVSHQPSML